MAGGTLEGRRLAASAAAERKSIRAALLAAAMANDWLQPGMRHQSALAPVECLAVTVNSADPVLCWYRFLWSCAGPPALGATGVSDAGRLGAQRSKLAEVNVRRAVHCRHGWQHYRNAPEIIGLLRQQTLAAGSSR